MSDQLWAVLLGAVIAGAVAILLARIESRRARDLARAQHAHELALAQAGREHARMEKRYDDLKSTYVQFATEMRRIVQRAARLEIEHSLADEDPSPEPDPWDTEPDAEQALADLRLFADDALYGAGRTWLDEYYKRYWWPAAKGQSPADVDGAEERFMIEAKRVLGLAG